MAYETTLLNTATTNSWVAIIPYSIIDTTKTSDFALNLMSFDFAGLIMGTTSISRFGEVFTIPSGAIDTDKIITFRYKPDSEWISYELLFKWFDRIQNNKKLEHEDYNAYINGSSVDITIWLLNEYKKPKLEWTFRNCYIAEFGSLEMSYDKDGGTNLEHNLSLRYIDFDFRRIEDGAL